jgi:hypothetical protein
VDNQVFKQVDPGFKFEAAAANKEYVPAPVNKLLKFNVSELETTEQINNFKTTPTGEDNPDFGKPQPVLIFKGKLAGNGIEADGQVYSTWITGYYKDGEAKYSFGDRSKFGKIAEALSGTVAEFHKLSAGEIIGLPFQCALQPGKKDPNKQLLNVDKIMPADESQSKLTSTEKTDLDRAMEEAIDALS